jgi:5'-nucleotidase
MGEPGVPRAEHGIPAGTALNVNIPKTRYAPQPACAWPVRPAPSGRRSSTAALTPTTAAVLLAHRLRQPDHGTDTDEWALANNYVSVVPCQFDLTAYAGLQQLSTAWQPACGRRSAACCSPCPPATT